METHGESARQANPKAMLLTAGAAVCLSALVALTAWAWMSGSFSLSPPAPPLGQLGAAPSFKLVDQAGKPFDSGSLKGKVWVAALIYTSCKGSCPLLAMDRRRLQKMLAGRPGFELVSISVDPSNDTPRKLSQYASQVGADLSNWVFLTGRESEIKNLAQKGFKLPPDLVGDGMDGMKGMSMTKAQMEADALHSSRLILVDGRGHIRGYFDGMSEDTAGKLKAAVLELLGKGSA